MSLDPELNALLSALVTAHVKLADGQARHDERFDRLADGQARHDERLDRLDATVAHLTTATETALTRLTDRVDSMGEHVDQLGGRVDQLGERLDQFTQRVDSFTKAVLEGFTTGATRDRRLEDDVRALEARVAKLEHAPTPG